ncbi:hypothetical protein [Shewanella algae]|uniref:hypothetical protein n=1 Tax=Shewanella algae TaxID=38313 RepID=UPI001AAF39B5|nr:hypothetical protein [Shewanella algae]MBO2583506.1 hypothetical protein [Shewanella algae]
MSNFFFPYIAFLYGAAYSIQQILEGIGLASSNFLERNEKGLIVGSYWSPTEAVIPILGLLLLYSIVLFFALLAAGFVIARWRGVAIVFAVLAVPGLLNVAGLWPQINYLPDSFYIGGGSLGSPLGFVPLLILGLLTGWCTTVIVYDSLNLTDKFRGYYDHLWYATALLAGVFFVADSVGSRHASNLAEENRISRAASLYLLSQVRSYDQFCKTQGLAEIPSCIWASDVQQTLNEYAAYGVDTFHQFGPAESAEIYSGIRRSVPEKEIIQIRKEIERYNRTACPVEELGNGVRQYAKPSGICQSPPSAFCRAFPDGPEGLVDKYMIARPVALASECIIPTLVTSKAKQEDLTAAIASKQKERYQRWWLFIALSAVVGGKVANSTTKVAKLDQRDSPDRRRLIRPLLRGLSRVVKRSVVIGKAIGQWLKRWRSHRKL